MQMYKQFTLRGYPSKWLDDALERIQGSSGEVNAQHDFWLFVLQHTRNIVVRLRM